MTIAAVRQAQYHFEHKANYDRQQKVDATIELAEWSLFSNAQIAMLTGLDAHDVATFTNKADQTGGRLNGASLGDILKLATEFDAALVAKITAAGTSSRMIAKLTGLSQSAVARSTKAAA